MTEMNFDIFNLDDSQMKIKSSSKKKDEVYYPKYSEGKDNTYTAILRFLPNPLDPYTKSSVKKISYWLDVPEIDLRGYFDSPSTIDQECPINKKYWDLYNKGEKGDARAANNAKKIGNRDTKFYSYVLVVKDPQKPELEGTVQVLKYANFIDKLIQEQENPKQLEGFEETEKCNVFNPITGKNFKLSVTKKGDYPNYDGSKFSEKKEPAKLNGKAVTDKATGKALMQLIADCKTKLESFEYTEWKEEDEEKILKYLKSLSVNAASKDDDDDIYFEEEKKSKNKPAKQKADDLDIDLDFDEEPKEEKKTTKKSETKTTKKEEEDDLGFDDDVFDEEPKEEKKTAKKEEKKPAAKKEEKKEESIDDDDLDDFLNDL